MDIGNISRNNKILIIEDDLTTKAVLEDMLRSNGYQTRHAACGADGLKAAGQWFPAVILLDLIMPGMNGIEVCKELRSMKLPYRPSVIIVSVKSGGVTIAEALSSGADDFISKPVNQDELIARIKAQSNINAFYAEMENDKKNLETMLAITNAMQATLDPAEVLNIIVHKVAEVTTALRCSIVLIGKNDEGYVLASHDDPSIRELKINLARYPEIKHVVASKTPLAIDDMVNSPLMRDVKGLISDLKQLSVLIVPIVFNDEVLGTLFLRTRMKEHGFTQKEIDFCRIVANSSFNALKNARLFQKVTEEKESLRELAVRDYLTSLYNHNFFYARLEEEFERAVRYETPLSLIMMDLDNFKRINDTYGHRVGDQVLKEVSAKIKMGVRRTDVLARYGGEEFSVILPHTLLKGAVEEAERLREMIASHSYAGLVHEKMTMSFGVASYPQKGAMNSGDIVNHADDALYKAKWNGKNCVMVAD